MALACRIARGPNLAPARLVVPMSKGIPATQNAAPRSWRVIPRKPGDVAKVGVSAMSGEAKDRDGDRTGPATGSIALGRGRRRCAADDELAGLVDLSPRIPGGVWIKLDAERRRQHRRGEVFGIFTALLAGHPVPVVFGDIAI